MCIESGSALCVDNEQNWLSIFIPCVFTPAILTSLNQRKEMI